MRVQRRCEGSRGDVRVQNDVLLSGNVNDTHQVDYSDTVGPQVGEGMSQC